MGKASEWTGWRETLAEHGAGDGHKREASVREQMAGNHFPEPLVWNCLHDLHLSF